MAPNGWLHKTVGDICHFVNGNGFKSSEWDTNGLPIIRIQNLNGSEDFNYFNGEIKEKWLVNTGDILFAWAGTKGVSFGAKRWFGPQGVLNQHIFRVKPLVDVDKEWLYLALLKVTQRVEEMAHGFKATLLHVQKGDITDQVINIPPLSEQKKIAQIISTWDQTIATIERLLDLARQQKKALMQQLLTGKKRFPGFEGEWKSGVLVDIANIDSGFAFKSDDFSDDDNAVPIIRMSDFKSGALDLSSSAKVIAEVLFGLDRFALKADDFVFGMSGSLTNYAWVKESNLPCYLNQRVGRIVAKDNADQMFVTYLYLSDRIQQSILDKAAGAAQLNISVTDLRTMSIKYPCLREQRQIAQVLTTSNQEIETLQSQLNGLKQEKKALMQALLTGKRRVQVAEAEVV
jgi:type I restriction enzyme S subunit